MGIFDMNKGPRQLEQLPGEGTLLEEENPAGPNGGTGPPGGGLVRL